MQRDVYAALIKKRTKERIPLRILQLSGEVTTEPIFDEVFDGHRLRRLILMTHMSGSDKTKGPLLPKDVVVNDYSKLKLIHQPHYMYKLLPLLCDNYVAFNALLGIVSSPGSPFTIDHRHDPTFRVTFGPTSKWRQRVCEFLYNDTDPAQRELPISERKLPIPNNTISHDALLINTDDDGRNRGGFAGTLNVVDALTELSIKEFAVMSKVLRSDWLQRTVTNDVDIAKKFFSCKNHFHFVGVRKPLAKREHLLGLAAANSLHIYEEAPSGDFLYSPPPPAPPL